MSEITISIEQYNLLYGKALAFDNIVDAIERNIDRNEVYPVNEKEILLLTGALASVNQDYYNIKFGDQQFRTDNVPSNSISCSPRIGFNWDILNNRKFILRGGTGLFIGRHPFAWLVSAVLNSGMGQTSYVATTANGKTMPTFTMSQAEMLQQINATSATSVPSGPTILSDDLRMPKTWKSSLAFDAKLPGDIDFTIE